MRRKTALFDVLGVRPEDDVSRIRRAWREKVKALHPDIAKDKDRSGQQLAQVNAAFDQLKTHTPFVDRRRGDRRKIWRSDRVWSEAERAHKRATAAPSRQTEDKLAQAERDAKRRKAAEEKAKMHEQAKAVARRNAAELEQKEAIRRARRAKEKRTLSKQDQASQKAAAAGYAQARAAISA